MKLRLVSIALVILAGLAAIIAVFSSYMAKENQYEIYLTRARANVEKEIPYNAYNNYMAAFEVRCDDESVYQEMLAQAELLGGDFYADAVKTYVRYFPESAQAYELLCKFYYDSGTYSRVLEVAMEAREKEIATEQVRDWYVECFYMLKTIKSGLDGAQTFLGSYARVELNGLYGYLAESGKYLLAPVYEQASPLLNSSAAVYNGEQWYMVNNLGYMVARPSGDVDSLSMLVNGKICVSKDGAYGYTTSAMTIPENLPYDYASNFRNGVAAVKKGDLWALINTDEEMITDYIFEDILLDEYDTCINSGVIFVKKDGLYYLMNAEGEKLSDQGFENAYPFAGGDYAAVCVDGLWGFADTEGNLVIQPQYESAKSFNAGLGAVCIDGLWGYVNSSGEIRIECQFEDCLPFADNGIAAVKENDSWNYVQLYAYYY